MAKRVAVDHNKQVRFLLPRPKRLKNEKNNPLTIVSSNSRGGDNIKTERDIQRQLNKMEHKIKECEREGRYSDAMVMRYLMDMLLWIVDDKR